MHRVIKVHGTFNNLRHYRDSKRRWLDKRTGKIFNIPVNRIDTVESCGACKTPPKPIPNSAPYQPTKPTTVPPK